MKITSFRINSWMERECSSSVSFLVYIIVLSIAGETHPGKYGFVSRDCSCMHNNPPNHLEIKPSDLEFPTIVATQEGELIPEALESFLISGPNNGLFDNDPHDDGQLFANLYLSDIITPTEDITPSDTSSGNDSRSSGIFSEIDTSVVDTPTTDTNNISGESDLENNLIQVSAFLDHSPYSTDSQIRNDNVMTSLDKETYSPIPNNQETSGVSMSAARAVPSKEKPPESYVNLIAKAILSTNDQKMMLTDIYDYIFKTYPFFQTTTCSWKNSVRHNLTVHECFMKHSRTPNGRGFYWAIHPACLDDFQKGVYDRRQARLQIKKNNKALEENIRKSEMPQNGSLRKPLVELRQLSQQVSSNRLSASMIDEKGYDRTHIQGPYNKSIPKSTIHYHSTPKNSKRCSPSTFGKVSHHRLHPYDNHRIPHITSNHFHPTNHLQHTSSQNMSSMSYAHSSSISSIGAYNCY